MEVADLVKQEMEQISRNFPEALALNLAFSCSLRIGEMLGLTWDLSLIHI